MSVSVPNQTLNETNLLNKPQLSPVPQSTNMMMRSLPIFLYFLSPMVLALPQPLDTMEDAFQMEDLLPWEDNTSNKEEIDP